MKLQIKTTFSVPGYPEFQENTFADVPDELGNELVNRGVAVPVKSPDGEKPKSKAKNTPSNP